MHSSIFIANKFLELAQKESVYVSPMKIIKLVYIAHGWMLGIHNRPLIKDNVEAWKYGPVIPELYRATRTFRKGPVLGPLVGAEPNESLLEKEQDILQQTFNVYGRKSALELSRLTHMQGSPWMTASGGEGSGEFISNDLLDDYYKRVIEARHQADANN